MEFRVTGLDGKVVVITGGARGMGAAYVRGFLAEGAKVVAADLSWDEVEGFRDEVKAAGGLPYTPPAHRSRAARQHGVARARLELGLGMRLRRE